MSSDERLLAVNEMRKKLKLACLRARTSSIFAKYEISKIISSGRLLAISRMIRFL